MAVERDLTLRPSTCFARCQGAPFPKSPTYPRALASFLGTLATAAMQPVILTARQAAFRSWRALVVVEDGGTILRTS